MQVQSFRIPALRLDYFGRASGAELPELGSSWVSPARRTARVGGNGGAIREQSGSNPGADVLTASMGMGILLHGYGTLPHPTFTTIERTDRHGKEDKFQGVGTGE